MHLLLERYHQLGEEFDPATLEPVLALRINTLKGSDNEIVNRLQFNGATLTPIPTIEHAYAYSSPHSLGSTSEFLQGFYYLQEPASQLPALILNPSSTDIVIDMCAAPGSKTTQLAALMKNGGTIVALDSSAPRLRALTNNLSRLGVTNTLVYKKDARYASDLGIKADRILLDVPCSGNFLIEPEFFTLRNLEGIRANALRQRALIKSALRCLKPGGILVYSTCSLEPEENELIIAWALEQESDLSLLPIEEPWGEPGLTKVFGQTLPAQIGFTRRLWPHKTGWQGFFMAKLQLRQN